MGKIAIVFGSTGGSTQFVARKIKRLVGADADIFNVAEIVPSDLEDYSQLILGTSTWGLGELQDDWEAFLPDFAQLDLKGKTIALFGLGDCESYPDSFVDAMGIIYEELKTKECTLVGSVDTDDYNFDESIAVVDGKFVGLPIDEDNESDKTDARLESWLKQITTAFEN